MKLPEGPRIPNGQKAGGLTKRMRGIKQGPAQPKEANLTQKTENNPFESSPNQIKPWKKGMKRPRGSNPVKQPKNARNRMSGTGGRTPGNPHSLGRIQLMPWYEMPPNPNRKPVPGFHTDRDTLPEIKRQEKKQQNNPQPKSPVQDNPKSNSRLGNRGRSGKR